MAWTYSDWITTSDATARLTQLRLHIKEVTDVLQKPRSQGALDQQMSRFELDSYITRLMSERARLEEALGLDLGAGVEPFVQVKPALDDNMAIED